MKMNEYVFKRIINELEFTIEPHLLLNERCELSKKNVKFL